MLLSTLLILFFGITQGMKTYQSSVPMDDQNADAGIRLVPTSSKAYTTFTNGLSFCGRFKYRRLGKYATIFFFASTYLDLQLNMGYGNSFISFGGQNWILKDMEHDTFYLWSPGKWHHLCLSFDRSTQHLFFIKDSITIVDKHMLEIDLQFLDDTMLEKVVFGKRSDKIGYSRHEGQITDINIWDTPLNQDQMKDWTACKSSGLIGNIVDWDNSEWILTNVREVNVSKESLCISEKLGPLLVPEKLNALESLQFCPKISGQIFVLKDQESLNTALTLSENSQTIHCNKRLWAGWWDQVNEGSFVDMNSGSMKLNVSRFTSNPWQKTQPNGDTQQNCPILTPTGLNDQNCIEPSFCFICELNESPIFKLRGLEDSLLDFDYAMMTSNYKNSKLYFSGFSKSQLDFDANSSMWKLISHDGNGVSAEFSGSTDHYPFGVNLWKLNTKSTRTLLSFSACQDTQFNCDDGTCVNLTKRCDGSMDCEDQSDERQCYKIIVGKGFNLVQMPPSSALTKSHSVSNDKLEIKCHVEISNILDISEVSAKVTLQMKITVEWTDQRIDFRDLKEDGHLNILTADEKRDLWMPVMIFSNTRNKQQAQFRNDSANGYVKIKKGAKAIQNPMSELHNGYRHSGNDCTIILMDFFTVDFIYNFEMNGYPFDTQRFQAFFILPSNDMSKVKLVTGNITYKGPNDLMKYTVLYFELLASQNGLVLEIILGRQILNEILTTVLPTVIIVLVCFTTNHYGTNHFDAIVAVNLTALLVMVTLFISVFSSLPRTSAVKIIDIWFIVTLFIPFLEVIIHTKMDMIKTQIADLNEKRTSAWTQDQKELQALEDAKNQKMKILNFLRQATTYGLPLATLMFLLGFFAVGYLMV